jgi:hypothetical protein
MKSGEWVWLLASVLVLSLLTAASDVRPLWKPFSAGDKGSPEEDVIVEKGEIGRYGGRLVISQRAEPKTLNPVTAMDGNSREIIGLIAADLIHINRYSQLTEPVVKGLGHR